MYRIWLKRRQQKGYLSECVCIQFLFTSAATIFLKFSIHRVHRPLALFDVRFFNFIEIRSRFKLERCVRVWPTDW